MLKLDFEKDFRRKINDKNITWRFDDLMSSMWNVKKLI